MNQEMLDQNQEAGIRGQSHQVFTEIEPGSNSSVAFTTHRALAKGMSAHRIPAVELIQDAKEILQLLVKDGTTALNSNPVVTALLNGPGVFENPVLGKLTKGKLNHFELTNFLERLESLATITRVVNTFEDEKLRERINAGVIKNIFENMYFQPWVPIGAVVMVYWEIYERNSKTLNRLESSLRRYLKGVETEVSGTPELDLVLKDIVSLVYKARKEYERELSLRHAEF